MTTSLTGGQWLACMGWALIVPVVIETEKVIRRRRRRLSGPQNSCRRRRGRPGAGAHILIPDAPRSAERGGQGFWVLQLMHV